jgi:hypothetical protein
VGEAEDGVGLGLDSVDDGDAEGLGDAEVLEPDGEGVGEGDWARAIPAANEKRVTKVAMETAMGTRRTMNLLSPIFQDESMLVMVSGRCY